MSLITLRSNAPPVRMPTGATNAPKEVSTVDDIGQWFDRATATPLGAVIVFLLIYLSRIALDEWRRVQVKPKHGKRKGKQNG